MQCTENRNGQRVHIAETVTQRIDHRSPKGKDWRDGSKAVSVSGGEMNKMEELIRGGGESTMKMYHLTHEGALEGILKDGLRPSKVFTSIPKGVYLTEAPLRWWRWVRSKKEQEQYYVLLCVDITGLDLKEYGEYGEYGSYSEEVISPEKIVGIWIIKDNGNDMSNNIGRLR